MANNPGKDAENIKSIKTQAIEWCKKSFQSFTAEHKMRVLLKILDAELGTKQNFEGEIKILFERDGKNEQCPLR